MERYSVLLVDDEEDVVQVIMKKLDWERMGYRIVGYARNGVEALEMAEELQPDVVMTDIKMPYMDGLTLCRKLKKLYRTIKMIIFSGFDEFEYAQEAIKAEVEEYILKPVNSNELRDVFERIKRHLDEERDEKRNIDKLRKYYMDSLPVLQENFYTSLLEGRILESQILGYMSDYQITLSGPYYVVSVLHISTTPLPGEEDGSLNPILLGVSVKKFAEEQLSGRWDVRVVSYLGDIIVLSQLLEPEKLVAFTDEMDKICKMAKRICNARVTAGIGHICEELIQLPLSYQGAKQAVSYRVLYGTMKAISISETDPKECVDVQWEDPYVKNIIKRIRVGDPEALKKAIIEFTERMARSKISMQKYRILILKVIAEIFRFGNNNQLNMEEIFGADSDIYGQALQQDLPESLGEWLHELCRKLQQAVQSDRSNTTKSFVRKAVEYIWEHYADPDLGIETLCAYLGVSAAYFSTVFKKETGKTFVKFLTDYRMEQAVELLLSGSEKTYVIAEKVGYSDPNYFSYAFKKQFGMAPSKYKAAGMEKG